ALVVGTTAFELSSLGAPPWRARPFSLLPRPRREAQFQLWWESRLPPTRQLAKALKGLLAFAYYEQPAVRARLGYLPEGWIAAVKADRLVRFRDAIAEHERLVVAPNPLVPHAATEAPRAAP